jgi:proteasome lid subunit RPN8/RPN11
LSPTVWPQILKLARASYPKECCGLLAGPPATADRTVTHFFPIQNINVERARDRYQMDPREQLAVEKEARRKELEVLGVFHSHPDHPAEPSGTDLAQAWPGYAYVIASVQADSVSTARCWELAGAAFREIGLKILS